MSDSPIRLDDSPVRQDAPPPPGPASRASNLVWIIMSIILVIAIVGIWLNLRSASQGTSMANAIIQGERPPAPPIPTQGIADDGAPGFSPTAARGHVLVVNFWASWCAPCRTEAPILERVSQEYAGRVTVVGIDAGAEDTISDARDFVREFELSFPIVRGDRGDKQAWGAGGYPETFIVGADGRVSAHVNGPVDRDGLHELLDGELAKDRRA